MDNLSEQLLNEYLDDVEQELSDVSPSLRRDFVAEIRSHFIEEWEHVPEQAPAAMRNILERFGDAWEIAADFREKHNLEARTSPVTTQPFPPVLIILLTIFIWPLGIILAWLSPSWKTKHKVVATVLPAGMILFLVLALMAGTAAYINEPAHLITETVQIVEESSVTEQGGVDGPSEIRIEQSGPSRPVNTLVMILMIPLLLVGNPLGSGIYLAITRENLP